MTLLDLLMVFVCIASIAVGFWRGFVKEAISLLTLAAAIWLAWRFGAVVEPYLGDWTEAPELRTWGARVVVFVCVMLAGGLIAWGVRTLIHHTGLSGTDRLLGGIFGFARGMLIVGLGVIALEFTGLDQDPAWQGARLKPHAERVADAIRRYAELGTRYLQEENLA